MLLLTAFLCGQTVRRVARERILLLQSSEALLLHARRKIDFFGTPADSLFSDFTDGFDPPTRRALREKSAEDALRLIAERLGEYGDALMKFSSEIGCGYREDALRLCDYCIEKTIAARTQAQEEYERRRKLYTALPLLFAISVIVLLI